MTIYSLFVEKTYIIINKEVAVPRLIDVCYFHDMRMMTFEKESEKKNMWDIDDLMS